MRSSFLALAASLSFGPALPGSAAVPTRGLLAHWTFDQDLGSRVNDALYQGQPHGNSPPVVDNAPGAARVGAGALRLDNRRRGENHAFVSVATPLFDSSGPNVFTVTAWFRLQDNGEGAAPRNLVWSSFPNPSFSFGVRSVGNDRQVAFFRFRTDDVKIYSDAPVSEASTPRTLTAEDIKTYGEANGPTIEPGVWYHSAVVWNAESRSIKSYLQGKLLKEIRLPAGILMEPSRGLNIGSNNLPGSGAWQGWIDDVAVFDLELSARQIGALSAGHFAGTQVVAANVLAVVREAAPALDAAADTPLAPPPVPAPENSAQGPLIGHVDATTAVLWARVPHAGSYRLTATAGQRSLSATVDATAEEKNDWCLHWKLSGLEPATDYALSFDTPAGCPFALRPLTFRTPAAPGRPTRVELGFGSCAEFVDSSIWTRIAEMCPDGMVLLGDTPYIDTTELRWQRWAYRRFASIPQLARAFQRIPFWATWDDHDFGLNDSNGLTPGKAASRQAFVEYHSNLTTGEAGQGIYTSFRRGPVEVFILDTRWFSATEPSWADPKKLTSLGRAQWEWLTRGLLASTAAFKILACGEIWDAKSSASDAVADHERRALQHWIGEHRIAGVILVGGDVHVSRLLKYDTTAEVGYDLRQLITSPLHDRVIPSANTPHPALLASAAEPFAFLKITADDTRTPATLKAEFLNRDGRLLFQHTTTARELSPR